MKNFYLIILSLAILIIPNQATACICSLPEPEKILEQSEYVFTGTVKEITSHKKNWNKVTFSVATNWKGDELKERTVETDGNNSYGCGFNFEIGKTYLVFPYKYSMTSSNTESGDYDKIYWCRAKLESDATEYLDEIKKLVKDK